MTTSLPLTFDHIQSARARIQHAVHRTPVITSASWDELTGTHLFCKAENLQKTGAFKARGAANAVLALPEDQAKRGVVTHSSGNHGAALARAAQLRGISATVVMPSNAPAVKQAAVRAYGGEVVFCEPNLAAREAGVAQVIEQSGAVLIHPYNDVAVMAGQGTAACELLEEVPDLEFVLTPVGGGGLLSGTAVATKALFAGTQVIGVEPAGADDAFRSFHTGRLAPPPIAQTIADGLRGALGDLTFAVIRGCVDDIVTVTEEEILAAMQLAWERMKLVVEPSAAVPLAALLAHRLPGTQGRRVGVILSGGNLDVGRMIEHIGFKAAGPIRTS